LSDTREEAAFREKARTWLEANLPKGVANRGFALAIDEESVRALTDWQRRLWEGGYLGLSWPKEYGGQGASMIESAIFNEEMARVRAPAPLNELGLSMGGPTILEHGTEEQKRRYLPKILSCEEVWCQGFSEPVSGSDLAALGTRAVIDGDHFVVNGQKVWTSLGHISDWCMLLVRTDANAPEASRHLVPVSRYAQPRSDGAAAAANHRRGRIQRDVFRRRAGAARKSARSA
jgi:alkylation response protein AidB-like acyl-CoA dehydrogenase